MKRSVGSIVYGKTEHALQSALHVSFRGDSIVFRSGVRINSRIVHDHGHGMGIDLIIRISGSSLYQIICSVFQCFPFCRKYQQSLSRHFIPVITAQGASRSAVVRISGKRIQGNRTICIHRYITGTVESEFRAIHRLSLLVHLLHNQIILHVCDIDRSGKFPREVIGVEADSLFTLHQIVIDGVFDHSL